MRHRTRRKLKKKHKYAAQRYHAKRRLLQRYGIELTDELRLDMISQIASGKAKFIERQSRRITVHLVRAEQDTFVPAVYDSNRKEIVTFLLREWAEES